MTDNTPARLDPDAARERFETIAETRFGAAWKARAAEFLGVNRRTLYRWIAAGEFPDFAWDRLSDDPAARLILAAQEAAERLADLGSLVPGMSRPPLPHELEAIRSIVAAVATYAEESGRG